MNFHLQSFTLLDSWLSSQTRDHCRLLLIRKSLTGSYSLQAFFFCQENNNNNQRPIVASIFSSQQPSMNCGLGFCPNLHRSFFDEFGRCCKMYIHDVFPLRPISSSLDSGNGVSLNPNHLQNGLPITSGVITPYKLEIFTPGPHLHGHL